MPTPATQISAPATGKRLAATGLAVNVLFACTKLAAGILGNSYALIADAIESMADIIGSVVIWGGLHIAARPADRDHPYGHGKAEALAAALVAGMVLVAGVLIGIKSVHAIVTPHERPEPFTLVVLVVVVLVKEGLYRLGNRAGRRLESQALAVDAWHHRSDAITSGAAFVGIGIALVGGPAWRSADGWAALAASGVIIVNAVRLFSAPARELMDAEPTLVVSRAREVAANVPGVVDVEKVNARKSGPRYWLDMHVRVDPQMTVRDAHAVAHAVKDAIRAAMPSVQDVLVHVEPARSPP